MWAPVNRPESLANFEPDVKMERTRAPPYVLHSDMPQASDQPTPWNSVSLSRAALPLTITSAHALLRRPAGGTAFGETMGWPGGRVSGVGGADLRVRGLPAASRTGPGRWRRQSPAAGRGNDHAASAATTTTAAAAGDRRRPVANGRGEELLVVVSTGPHPERRPRR